MASATNQSKIAAWVQATRPRVFTASFVPMGLAAVIAIDDGVFNLWYFVLALLGVMFLQTTANLVNEYMDFKRGSDDLKQAGQSMALKQKLLTEQEILYGAIFATLAGIAIGLYLLFQSGPWLWAIGIGGVLIAITYTAGPFPLAYNGLGEVAAGVFMGPMIVLGAYYVMSPDLTAFKAWQLTALSFPIMFTTAAILHANNIRDLEADRVANKRTLAVVFGRDIARKEYIGLLVAAYVSQFILIALTWMPITTLLTLLMIPTTRKLIHIFNTETDPKILHPAQGNTAKLHGQFGLLMVLGWAIWLAIAPLLG
ncbi:MAG: 1,4-dihydroxy-2-naphthoate octaprenyltransferase [Chloroflexota bacterium]